uniref:adenosine deaminase n=1 Tax=Caenorhabditis tropicalis TaxID=1561998 RepID=A0A1I7V057_9PELO
MMLLALSDPTLSVSCPEVTTEMHERLNFPKVELHLHLDGAARFDTLLELSQEKGISLAGAKTVDELKKVLVTHEPANLSKVLEAFEIFLPVIRGDLTAIERVAYELCEDQHHNGVVYFEGRYSPHLLLCNDYPEVTAAHVVAAVKKGFDRGEKQFGIKARSILCCIRGLDKKFPQLILDLATDLKQLGVVAIDVAGSAHGADEQYEPEVVAAFKEAFKRGIHRTVHAGESGGPKEVQKAIEDMHAERIGHGYRVMKDEQMYIDNFVNSKSVHLEACPYSSVMTGAVPLDWKNHPISRWAKDDVNFSISRDDPTCFDNSMLSELTLAHKQVGLDVHQLWKAQLNAAHSCFLPEDEKAELVKLIESGEPPRQ